MTDAAGEVMAAWWGGQGGGGHNKSLLYYVEQCNPHLDVCLPSSLSLQVA